MFIKCFAIITLSILIFTFSSCSSIFSDSTTRRNQETTMKKFYDYVGPEETLMDPLILSGEKIVPFVISEIKNKKMPKRRYAIGFLGNGQYGTALKTLEEVLQDSIEDDLYRGDALLAIFMINNDLGIKYAKKYKSDSGFVKEVAKDILNNSPDIHERRTYWQALANSYFDF